MKKINIDKSIKDNIFTYSISGIIIACFILFVLNFPTFLGIIKDFLGVISPFLWGLLFAYLGKGIALFIELHLPNKWSFTVRRVISSILSIIFIILCISLIFIIVIPQLGPSISSISNYISEFIAHLGDLKSYMVNDLKFDSSFADSVIAAINQGISLLYEYGSQIGSTIISFTISTIGNLFNFLLGLVIALFFLIERGKIKKALMNFGKMILSDKSYSFIKDVYLMSVSKFYGYFRGSIIDSILVGFECFILMSIFKLEYSSLISVIVGLTNVIPFFGPFIGGIPAFLLLVLVNPIHALIFAGIAVAIQQIDGNFIAPKIIGDSVGVPRLWCMFVIIVGGAYFGFAGMIFGVPLFSVVYFFVKDYFKNKKLKTKK